MRVIGRHRREGSEGAFRVVKCQHVVDSITIKSTARRHGRNTLACSGTSWYLTLVDYGILLDSTARTFDPCIILGGRAKCLNEFDEFSLKPNLHAMYFCDTQRGFQKIKREHHYISEQFLQILQ